MGYARENKNQTFVVNDEKMSTLNRLVLGFAWFFIVVGVISVIVSFIRVFTSKGGVDVNTALIFAPILGGLLLMVFVRINHNTEMTAKALKDILASQKSGKTAI